MKKILFILCTLFSVSVLPQNENKVVILHTNDTHSQIEPLCEPGGDVGNGKGGLAIRATIIKQIRAKYQHVLMLDAGDFVQGTPYFNLFDGELEVKAMNLLGYDVVTLGNHEFDNGVLFLANMLKEAAFDVVSTNYDVSNTPLKDLVKPYVIKMFGSKRIGIIGLGVNPDGVISDKNFEGVRFLDPIVQMNQFSKLLKEEMNVDYVIALTHLGYHGDASLNDKRLAALSRNVDLIVGGHSHTYMEEPDTVLNIDGKPVLITQAGSNGVYIGQIGLNVKSGEYCHE